MSAARPAFPGRNPLAGPRSGNPARRRGSCPRRKKNEARQVWRASFFSAGGPLRLAGCRRRVGSLPTLRSGSGKGAGGRLPPPLAEPRCGPRRPARRCLSRLAPFPAPSPGRRPPRRLRRTRVRQDNRPAPLVRGWPPPNNRPGVLFGGGLPQMHPKENRISAADAQTHRSRGKSDGPPIVNTGRRGLGKARRAQTSGQPGQASRSGAMSNLRTTPTPADSPGRPEHGLSRSAAGRLRLPCRPQGLRLLRRRHHIDRQIREQLLADPDRHRSTWHRHDRGPQPSELGIRQFEGNASHG